MAMQSHTHSFNKEIIRAVNTIIIAKSWRLYLMSKKLVGESASVTTMNEATLS